MAFCSRCEGKGAVTLNYHSGEPIDLGLCDCPEGQLLRRTLRMHPALIQTLYRVPLDRVHPIEDLLESTDHPETSSVEDDEETLLNAAKVNRAGLGGQVKR